MCITMLYAVLPVATQRSFTGTLPALPPLSHFYIQVQGQHVGSP